MIESPRIATALGHALDGRALVHEVRTDGAGGLEWHETRPDGTVVAHRTEPNASLARRAFVRVASWLPIEWML
jgi:putative cardiolipin synthase